MTPKPFTRMKSKHDVITIYKPILLFLMLFGYNYNVSQRLIAQITYRIFSFSLIIIVLYSTFACCEEKLSLFCSLLEYTCFTFFLLIYRSKVPIYFGKVLSIDTYLRINHRYYLNSRVKQAVFFLIMTLIRFAHTFVYCIMYDCYRIYNYGLFTTYGITLLALDYNRVWRYCMYEDLWKRVKLLRTRIEEAPENIYLYVKDNKAMKERKIKFCLYLYRSVADLMDLICPELSASLLVSIVCNLPKLIINLYYILLVIDKQLPVNSMGSMFIHLTQTFLFILMPCVISDLIYTEVEKIRIFLMHQLVNETDPQTKEDIDLFLQYTHLRPLRHKIGRVIYVDLNLPLALVNFCTTYVIVVLNFTKAFE